MGDSVDLLDIFKTEEVIFTVLGVYPLKTRKYWLLHYLSLTHLCLASLGQFLPMSIQLYFEHDNLSVATDICLMLCTQAAYLSKLINFVVNRHLIFGIEEALQDPIMTEGIREPNEYMKGQLRFLTSLKVFFRGVTSAVVVFYALQPQFDEGVTVPENGWYPFDQQKNLALIYIFQIWTLAMTAATNSNLDLYAASLIVIGSSYLNILKEKLSKLDYAEDAEGRRNVELENCVSLHKHVLKYISMIENMFSYGIFVQFLASIVVICLTGFQMLVVPIPSAQFMMLISYISCMMCQVAMYCWFGNEILTESDGISNACYMSNWYLGTKKSKKVLLFIMERSKREIKLTAGKFFTLSLTTLVMIMKSSYSYFAVLQRIYKDD